MGGCRCNFRGCDNGTASRPGMHFFHFPTKDNERCDKWIEFSNNPTFKGMEEKKLRNRNVCEEHFRLKMFMNVRKERLVRFAIPTLLKTKLNGKVYDLEKMLENQVDIDKLYGGLSVDSELEDDFDEFLVEDSDSPFLAYLVEPPPKSFRLNEQNITEIPIDFHDEEKSPEKVTIVKKLVLTPVNIKKKVIKRPIVTKDEIVLTPVPRKKPKMDIKILNSTNVMKTVPNEPIEIQSMITSASVVIKKTPSVEKRLEQRKEDLERIRKITEDRDTAKENEKKLKQEVIDCHSQIEELELKVKELEHKIKIAENKKPKTPIKAKTKVNSTQTDVEKPVEPKIVEKPSSQSSQGQKPGALSKPELFKGIKRYLSNAMATLLKMEMFGNTEREWKQDEKKIACEVMQLGKEVYEYFTDEWRFRLPSKSEVTTWLQDTADDDDEDLF